VMVAHLCKTTNSVMPAGPAPTTTSGLVSNEFFLMESASVTYNRKWRLHQDDRNCWRNPVQSAKQQ
jgi:hypothetical protein